MNGLRTGEMLMGLLMLTAAGCAPLPPECQEDRQEVERCGHPAVRAPDQAPGPSPPSLWNGQTDTLG